MRFPFFQSYIYNLFFFIFFFFDTCMAVWLLNSVACVRKMLFRFLFLIMTFKNMRAGEHYLVWKKIRILLKKCILAAENVALRSVRFYPGYVTSNSFVLVKPDPVKFLGKFCIWSNSRNQINVQNVKVDFLAKIIQHVKMII